MEVVLKTAKQLFIVVLFLLLAVSSNSIAQITTAQSGNWNDTGTWTGGVIPTANDDVIISNTVTVNITDAACKDLTVADGGRVYFDLITGLGLTVNGSVTVNSNGRIQAAGSTPSSNQYFQQLIIKKDLTVDAGGRFDMRQSSGSNLAVCRVLFSGNTNSVISLSLDTYTSNTEEFNSVEINKTDGAKVILSAGTLFQNNNSSNGADTLLLTSGVVETGSHHWVTLRTTSESIIGASSLSYINGILGRGISNGGSSGTLEFPIGDADGYRPITLGINAPSNSTGHYVWAQVVDSNANTGSSSLSGGISNVSVSRYYKVGYLQNAGSSATMDFYSFGPSYSTDDGVNTGNTDLRVAYSTDSRATFNNAGPSDHTTDLTTVPTTIMSDSLNPNITVNTGENVVVALASVNGSNPLPVELTSFNASAISANQVKLSWSTATEKNNSGFVVERSVDNKAFNQIGFVKGNGTVSEISNYSFVDKTTAADYFYRLKQVDMDGSYNYSKVIEVNLAANLTFSLAQNFPNPFNPSTTIKYSIAKAGFTKLTVYNSLGQAVKVLVNEVKTPGEYNITFDASHLSSGLYFYKLETDGFVKTNKMLLVK